MSKRQEAISKEIAKILSKYFLQDYPDAIVTVFDVVISEDLQRAKVWLKVIGDRKIFDTISKKKDRYRFLTAHSLKLKNAPYLEFIFEI